MTSSDRLRALLASEETTVDDLIAAVKEARTARDDLDEATGRALAALNRRMGLTFEEIALRTEIKGSTAHRWAKPYLS